MSMSNHSSSSSNRHKSGSNSRHRSSFGQGTVVAAGALIGQLQKGNLRGADVPTTLAPLPTLTP
jgi:hypothetical protein